FANEYHDIMVPQLLKSLEHSGLISDELLEHIALNKNSHVYFNVLRYFEKDPEFNGVIVRQVGTLSEVGDELASDIQKKKAIFSLSEYQSSQNAAVNLAR